MGSARGRLDAGEHALGADIGGLGLDQDPALVGQRTAHMAQQCAGVAPDPDAPVEQQRAPPAARMGSVSKTDRCSTVARFAGRWPRQSANVEAEGLHVALEQGLHVAPGPAAHVEHRRHHALEERLVDRVGGGEPLAHIEREAPPVFGAQVRGGRERDGHIAAGASMKASMRSSSAANCVRGR